MGDRQRGRRAAPQPPNGAPDPERRVLARLRRVADLEGVQETGQELRAEAAEMLRRRGRAQGIRRARLDRQMDVDEEDAQEAEGAGDIGMDVVLAGQPEEPTPTPWNLLHELPGELFRKIMSLLDVRDVARLAATARPFWGLLGANTPYGVELRLETTMKATPPLSALEAIADSRFSSAGLFSEADVGRLLQKLHAEFRQCLRKNLDSGTPIHALMPAFGRPFWLSKRLRRAIRRAFSTLPDRPAHPLELATGQRHFMWRDGKWRKYPESDVTDFGRNDRAWREKEFMENFRARLLRQPYVLPEERAQLADNVAQHGEYIKARVAVAMAMDERASSIQSTLARRPPAANGGTPALLTLREVVQRGFPLIGHAIFNWEMQATAMDTRSVFHSMLSRERSKRIARYMLSGVGTPGTSSYIAPVMAVHEFIAADYALLMAVIHTDDIAMIDAVMNFGAYWSRPRGLTHEEITNMVQRDPSLVTLGDLRRSLVTRHRRELRLGRSVVLEPLTEHETEEIHFNRFMDTATPLADEITYRHEPSDWMNAEMQHFLAVRLISAPHDQATVMTVLKHMRPDLPLCFNLLEECPYRETLAAIYAYQVRVLGVEWSLETATDFVLDTICHAMPVGGNADKRSAESLKAWDISRDNSNRVYHDAEFGTVELPAVNVAQAVSWKLLRRRHYTRIFEYLLQCMDRRLRGIAAAGGSETEKAEAKAFIIMTNYYGGEERVSMVLRRLLHHCSNGRAVLEKLLSYYETDAFAERPTQMVTIAPYVSMVLDFYKKLCEEDSGDLFGDKMTTSEFMEAFLPHHSGLYGCLKYLSAFWQTAWPPVARVQCLVKIAHATYLSPTQQTIRPTFWKYWQFLVETMALLSARAELAITLNELRRCAPMDLSAAIALTMDYPGRHSLIPSWLALGEIHPPMMSEELRLSHFKEDVDLVLVRLFRWAYQNSHGDILSQMLRSIPWVRRQLSSILEILLDPPLDMPSRLRVPPQVFDAQHFPHTSRTYNTIYVDAIAEATPHPGAEDVAFMDADSAMQFLDRLGLPRPPVPFPMIMY